MAWKHAEKRISEFRSCHGSSWDSIGMQIFKINPTVNERARKYHALLAVSEYFELELSAGISFFLILGATASY